MAAPDQKHVPSQEHLLLDYVRRLEKHKEGRRAVHIHLSRLRPYNRREQHMRAAISNFDNLVRNLMGQLFTLKTSDLYFIFKDDAHAEAETAVQKTRFMFSDDPLIADEEASGQSFADWYVVQDDYDRMVHFAQGVVDSEQRRTNEVRDRMDTRAALKAKQQQGDPLNPEVLSRVEDALSRADLSNLVRRQFICGLNANMAPEPIFSELFISIQDLRETLLPGVNLTANRWLFQHLTETLDKRMLAMLVRSDQATLSGDVSFNMNVATLLSQEFTNFDENITASRRGTIVIELNILDIFGDIGAFLFAKEFAQEKGYRICLDGLTHQIMFMIHRERISVDMIKLIWHPEMFDAGEDMHRRIRDFVDTAGTSKVIMCRVDTREAIDFGRSVGIELFQGRQVENLIAEDNRRRELLRLKRRIERS